MFSFSRLFATFSEGILFEIFYFFSEVSKELKKRLTSLTPLLVNMLHLLRVANYTQRSHKRRSVQPGMDVHSEVVKPGPLAIT